MALDWMARYLPLEILEFYIISMKNVRTASCSVTLSQITYVRTPFSYHKLLILVWQRITTATSIVA